jgi:deoxyribonuclease-4
LDTCHVFAAGHDLAACGGVARLLAALAPVVERGPGRGGSRLRLIHANDSKDGCGSHRDRHENIGAGRIGTAPFAALLHHPATRGVPFIVETPGSHAADVATLKALRQTRRPAPAPATRMR